MLKWEKGKGQSQSTELQQQNSVLVCGKQHIDYMSVAFLRACLQGGEHIGKFVLASAKKKKKIDARVESHARQKQIN